MRVTLINYTPNPEETVAAAARLCYSPAGAEEIMEQLDQEKRDGFLEMLTELGHFSPTEHVSFTFAIEGVSRALSHQLVRHRIASYSQKSQRYVNEGGFDFIIPPTVQKKPEALKVFQETMNLLQKSYATLQELVPKEDARFVLPNACETKLVATFNTRSLFNFFQHRCCVRAQWEIRMLANKMLAEVQKVAPVLFKKAGPLCESAGYCPEGQMSCGRIEKIRKVKD